MRDVSCYTRIDRLDKASIDKSAIAESRVICQFRGADVLRAFTRSLVSHRRVTTHHCCCRCRALCSAFTSSGSSTPHTMKPD
jgi:hypothetical protein